MTLDKITLRKRLEKGSDPSFLREMTGVATPRLMELETVALCSAGHGEQSAGHMNHRKGFRDRD